MGPPSSDYLLVGYWYCCLLHNFPLLTVSLHHCETTKAQIYYAGLTFNFLISTNLIPQVNGWKFFGGGQYRPCTFQVIRDSCVIYGL